MTNPFLNKTELKSFYGSPSTVEAIRRGVLESQRHFHVRQLAEIACDGVAEKDYCSEPLAILYFVSRSTVYRRDPRTIELVKAPYVVAHDLLKGKTPQLDCDDMCALICALCSAMGCETRVITFAFTNVFVGNERQYSHISAQARDPKTGAWITLDPVAGPKIDEMQNRAVAVKIWRIA